MTVETSTLDFCLRMAVLGIGLGPGQSLFSMAIQNALPPTQMGVATSSSQFFRQIGSTIGVALFGTLLTARLNAGLGKIMPGVDVGELQGMGVQAQTGAAPQLPTFVRETIAGAITHTFSLGMIVVTAALVAVLFIPHVPMREAAAKAPPAEA